MDFSSNQFSEKQRQELGRVLITKYSYFYHCTDRDKLDNIKKTGLNITYCNRENLVANEPAAIRYFIEKERDSIVRMKEGNNPEKLFVVLAVFSRSIISRLYGLDWSASQTTHFARKHNVEHEAAMTVDIALDVIEKSGFLSCYETIPPNELYCLEDGKLVDIREI